jgi:dipeptidyl-peptidase-3
MFQVLSNLVNYKTFGFTKIVPRVPVEKFEAVIKHSANATEVLALWKDASHSMKITILIYY